MMDVTRERLPVAAPAGDGTAGTATANHSGVIVMPAVYLGVIGCVLVAMDIFAAPEDAEHERRRGRGDEGRVWRAGAARRVALVLANCVPDCLLADESFADRTPFGTYALPARRRDGGDGGGDGGNCNNDSDVIGQDLPAIITGGGRTRRGRYRILHNVALGANRLCNLQPGLPFLVYNSVSGNRIEELTLQVLLLKYVNVLSVCRPDAGGVLSLLRASGHIARASVLVDLRDVKRAGEDVAVPVRVAFGAADHETPAEATVRLYGCTHPSSLLVPSYALRTATQSPLARLVAVQVRAPDGRVTPVRGIGNGLWAIIDVASPYCMLDSHLLNNLKGALRYYGPSASHDAATTHTAWHMCPIWFEDRVDVQEAAAVLAPPVSACPTVLLVFEAGLPADAQHSSASARRRIEVQVCRDAFVSIGTEHVMRHTASFLPTPIETRVRLAAFAFQCADTLLPHGFCVIGNCAFVGKAFLLDYDRDALFVYRAA
jgi:hypothetical protein